MALTKTDNIASEYVTEDLIGQPIRERTMKISENALKQLAIMFTDLYSNPIEAMVRETVSNATDATIKARRAGQDAPDVEIIRPALSEQSLTVIDHGVGMTQHELDIYFSDYGNSTKINDMDAIGSKGLGAKAMLAYSPSAKVITVKDGTEIIMTMTRGEKDNFTSIESVTKTNKHNGTTIIIPVKSKDIDAVNEAIDRYARYAPAEAPITIDGIKHSLSERYVKLTDIKIGEDVDKTTGRVKPVMGAVWARKNTGSSYGSSYDHTPQVSNNVSDVAISWNETLDNVMTGRDEEDSKWVADNYVRNNVCVTLSGWNYTLRPSSDREANRYHSSYSSYSSYSSGNNQDSSYRFVVEIQPGVVNFPAHRDNIINDHRLEMLVDRIANGLRLRKTIVDKSDDGTVLGRKKNDNVNAVHLWEGIPEEMRVPLVSRLFNEVSSNPWRKSDILTTWVSMDDVWPEVFEEFREDLHEDAPSFYGVVSYTTESNWRNTKILFDQQVSMINCVTHGKDPKNKTGRTYRTYNMIPIENKQMVPYLSLNEDYIEGERDSKSLNASILPFDAKRQLLYSDKTTYRGEQVVSQMWDTIIDDPSLWNYDEVRSIPVDFVIKSGGKRPYGVPATAADHWCLTIVQGDLGDWKNTKRKMGLLRRISRVRHEKGQQGHHVFYLVAGELDKKTLDKAVAYFKGVVDKSKENGSHSDHGTPVWMGVTTYDALKTEAAKFDASKRKLNADPADNTTVYDVIPAAKWTVEDGDEWHVAAEMAHYVNRIQRGIDPMARTTANVNEIVKAGDPVILFDGSTMKDVNAIKFSVFKTVVDEFGGLGSKTYWAISTSDVNAAFMNKLVKSPNVWVMDSTRPSFNNLKAVKSGGLMHVVKINETYTTGDIQRRGLQFLYDHVTPQDSFDVFSELFASSIPQLSRTLWACIDGDDSVLFPHPDKVDDPKVKAMVELLSLGRASGWNDWYAIHKWIEDHETRDDLKSQEFLRLMRAWELVFGYVVEVSGRSFYTSTRTSMDMARKAELQAFSSSFMNNYSLTDNCEAFVDKESDFTKQVHDGFLGMSLRAWWEELKK